MIPIETKYAAESGHYYRLRDGAPFYEVMGRNGPRATTVRDFKKLLGTDAAIVPSVTTILKCAAAPGLERWKIEQTMLAALTLPKIDGEDEKSYLNRIIADSKEQARRAADRGTAIHAAIQMHYEGQMPDESYWPFVQAAKAELERLAPRAQWIAEASFAHPAGYGGKVDLHCKSGFVVDIKTKEFDESNPPSGYEEHAMQLAACAWGLGLDNAECANLFVSASNPGISHLHIWEPADIRRGLRMFRCLLSYWKAKHVPEMELAID